MKNLSPRTSRSLTLAGLMLVCGLSVPAMGQLCPAGFFNPNGGLAAGDSECVPGYYTSTAGQTVQTPASPGYFVPGSGATDQIQASIGNYVPSPAATAQFPASAGYYVPTPASSTQIAAPAGSYVASMGASIPTQCMAGYYTSSPASTSPTPASPGNFVPITDATQQTPAPRGYFVSSSGQSQATAAPIGTFVPSPGSDLPIQDPVGTTTPHVASFAPRSSSVGNPRGTGYIVGPIYSATPSPTIDLTAGPNSLDITNASTDLGITDTLTGLSILSATLSGSQASDFQMSNFTPETVLYELGTTDINFSVPNAGSLAPGLYSATLTIVTDQSAPFGTSGQSFTYNVDYNAGSVPEPASLSIAGIAALLGLTSRRKLA